MLLQGEQLILSESCLVVYVDDTGNETFKGQPYFGLGAVALLVREHERQLKPRWRELRRTINGNPDAPLHAADLGHAKNMAHIEAAVQFFKDNHVVRFGVATTDKAQVPASLTRRQPVYYTLKKYIEQHAAVVPCDSVAVIFESSERANEVLQREFGDLRVARAGVELPAECYFMPKSAAEPGLEAADFIANAVGSMTRRMMEGRRNFPADFCGIFHSVPEEVIRFMFVASTEAN